MTPRADKNAVTIGTAIACTLAALTMMVLTAGFRGFVERHRIAYHEGARFGTLLLPARNVLETGPFLWVAALAASLWGFRLLVTRARSVALGWFLWSLVLTLLVLGLMTWALLAPFFRYGADYAPF